MELIAVVMKGPDRDTRNNDAKTLLNYGFSTYALVTAAPEQPLMPVPVDMGTADTVQPVLASEGNTVLVEKEKAGMLERKVTLEPRVTAPVAAGQPLGELTVLDGDTVFDGAHHGGEDDAAQLGPGVYPAAAAGGFAG